VQPGDPYADLGDRTTLGDDVHDVLLVFSRTQSAEDETAWADGAWADSAWVPNQDLVGPAAEVALHALAGWLLSTADPVLTAALLSGGATIRRHAHTMTHGLKSLPVARDANPGATGHAAGLLVEPLTAAQAERHAARLGAVHLRAYPPGHPDALNRDAAAAAAHVRSIARGEPLGRLLAASRVALAAHTLVGACLVVERAGIPPYGGPWIIDLFRDPHCPASGVGWALLESSLVAARDARLAGLSLAVSHANERARRLYLRSGFAEVEESWTLALP